MGLGWGFLLSFLGIQTSIAAVRVSLNSLEVLSVTEPTYASWNIDSSCNRGFHHINFSNPSLLAAARGLHPSKLRFGGSGNDNLIYGLSPGSPECSRLPPETGNCTAPGYINAGCLNATHWRDLHGLAAQSGSQFIFGVAYGMDRACSMGRDYVWDGTNALQLLKHIATKNQSVWGFEFGNEINNQGPTTECNQTAAQQAHGQLEFAQMVKEHYPAAKLIGPDSGGRDPQDWLAGYLPLVSHAQVHAITHHVYAGISHSTFNLASKLDASITEIGWYSKLVSTLAPHSQKWAGENGPAGGGPDGTCGTDSVCGTYATTMWYADDLALRAKHGFVQYQRQDLIGGHYGLVNTVTAEQTLSPSQPVVARPDYWVNFLYKRLIGTNVLNASSSDSNLRAYAFSADPPSRYAETDCRGGAIQLLLINLENKSVAVNTSAVANLGAVAFQGCSAWSLSPSNEGPFSEKARLNGEELPLLIDVSSQGSEPTFLTTIQQAKQRCSLIDNLPPLSTTFMCIKGDHV